MKMETVKAVILAAGLGTRMKTKIPKVLHRAGSQTLLGRVVGSLKKAGVNDITAVVGYGADMVKEAFKGEGIKFVEQKKLLGSGDALKCALREIEDDGGLVLVACGDAPLVREETFRELVEKHTGDDVYCTVLTCEAEDPYSYGRIVKDASGCVKRIVEEKDATDEEKKIREINTGMYCFRGDGLKGFMDMIEINEKKKEFYLTDIVEILANDNKKVTTASCPPEEAVGINSRGDLAMVNKHLNRETINRLMEQGVTIIDPDTTFVDESASIGKDTTICPCTVIEEDVVIGSGCSIGPFARIRPGTRISSGAEIGSFVELSGVEIAEGAKVPSSGVKL